MKIDELTEVLEPRKETTEQTYTPANYGQRTLTPGVFTDFSPDYFRNATRHAPPRITSAEALKYIGETVDEYGIHNDYNRFMERLYVARNRGYIMNMNQSSNYGSRYSYETFGYGRGTVMELELTLINNIKIEISLRIDENR